MLRRAGAGALPDRMSAARTRVFSDLHFRDPRGLLHELEGFAPLLGEAERVVLNGDSLDTLVPSLACHAPELRDFAARSARDFIWLSGNHDPDISDEAELALADERVWVTHGDVFFHAIAPWSHQAAALRRRLAEESVGLPADEAARIETRLRLHREVVRTLPEPPHFYRPGPFVRLHRLAHALFPPGRLLTILHTWSVTPRVVAALARAQRPRAQVVLLGHTHFPGVWRVPGPRGAAPITVVNTGSFTRPLGGLFAELAGEELQVRRIRREGNAFREGALAASIRLEKAPA